MWVRCHFRFSFAVRCALSLYFTLKQCTFRKALYWNNDSYRHAYRIFFAMDTSIIFILILVQLKTLLNIRGECFAIFLNAPSLITHSSYVSAIEQLATQNIKKTDYTSEWLLISTNVTLIQYFDTSEVFRNYKIAISYCFCDLNWIYNWRYIIYLFIKFELINGWIIDGHCQFINHTNTIKFDLLNQSFALARTNFSSSSYDEDRRSLPVFKPNEHY